MILQKKSRPLFLIIFFTVFYFVSLSRAIAQTDTPTQTPSPTGSVAPTPDVSNLQSQISQLESKINDLQGQEKTLSSQIVVMDSQIKLTEYRIEATKRQILSLEEDIDTAQKKISHLEDSLSNLTKILVSRMITGYEIGAQNQFQVLLSSDTISDFFVRANYLRVVERHDKRLIYDTVQAKDDYANQKQIFESERKKVITLQIQLENYTQDLNNQKTQKQALLSETQGSEANYQRLLAQAQAQLAGFSGFAQSQGGASILSNQTVCDSWGCYYNQRDSQWGNMALNNTQYTLASDGCLLTSMAMVYTHYGHRDVTPISINSNPSNFAAYYPAYLKYDITANGVSSQRVSSYIDQNLQNGNPVIVGIRYASGDTHFVVIVGGSSGNYLMNDPFTPNGHNISFTSKYSISSIFEIDKVVF